MTATTKEEFMAEWHRTHDHGVLPGAMLMKYGPEEYIGAAICVRGTLYFKNSHTPEVREAISKCFDAYLEVAESHLTWLLREEPPDGPNQCAYIKAPPLRSMLRKLEGDDLVSFAYSGGASAHDASPWLFYVSGRRGWEAKLGWKGLDSLQFSIPKELILERPTLFQRLFIHFARLLRAEHGHGGYALNLSLTRPGPNEPTEAFMTSAMAGLDAGSAVLIAAAHNAGIDDHIANIGWLTAINSKMLEKVGGLQELHSTLPANWFAKYDYGNGIVIQAGPEPEIAAVTMDSKPSLYVLPSITLRDLRITPIEHLHYGSSDGEPRLTGLAAKEWYGRFDAPDSELLSYRAKLLHEPALTEETTLPERL
jgi:hypothetical protein